MLIYKNHDGSLIISDMVNGQYIDRVYQGYTRREAIAKFKKEMKEMSNGAQLFSSSNQQQEYMQQKPLTNEELQLMIDLLFNNMQFEDTDEVKQIYWELINKLELMR